MSIISWVFNDSDDHSGGRVRIGPNNTKKPTVVLSADILPDIKPDERM